MDIAILFGLLFVLLALSVPIGISLGIATAITILTCSHLPLVLIAQNAFTGMDSFPMLAIPFFMLAGSLMTYGGISRRIVDMAECFVGFITGGLAMVTIVACMFFGAISGSAAATVSAIGSFMVPMMVEKKYKPACWLGYLAMCLMHSSGILMMMIRIALLLSGKKNSKFMSVLVFFAMILGGAVVPRLGEITNIEYLQLISEKAERATATSGFVNGTQYLVNVSVFVVSVCVFYYAVYVIKKQTEKYESFSDYINFVQLIVFFMLGSITFTLTFIRFARWVIPAVISVVFMVGMQANSNAKIEMLTGRKNKSVIKSGMTLSSNELVINFCMVGYLLVHMWYACNGTSLIWLHFS